MRSAARGGAVRWFPLRRASAASDASGALGRFCDPPAFLKACANESSLRMFSKGRDDYGRHAKHFFYFFDVFHRFFKVFCVFK